MSAILSPKLHGVNPKLITMMADYDLTLADKLDPDDTDKAPLMSAHYKGLVQLADCINRLIIVTARGEVSILKKYLAEHVAMHGLLPNTTIASNSGHRWHKLDQRSKEEGTIRLINIPGFVGDLNELKDELHRIAGTLFAEFPDIKVDYRELCSAVVFNFQGKMATCERFHAFQARAEQLKDNSPLADQIKFSPKAWDADSKHGPVTMGYIDILPKRMSKGVTTPVIFDHYNAKIALKDRFAVVLGDSGADFDMMRAIASKVPPERRIFVSVGTGLIKCDDDYERETGGRLLDHIFLSPPPKDVEERAAYNSILARDLPISKNGDSAVNQTHDFLSTIYRQPAYTPQARSDRMDDAVHGHRSVFAAPPPP